MHLLTSVNPMLAGIKHSIDTVSAYFRDVRTSWWGGIGCRLAFLMTAAIVLVTCFLAVFLSRDEGAARQKEVRGRAHLAAELYAILLADDLRTGNREGLARKLQSAFLMHSQQGGGPISLLAYDRSGRLLAGVGSRSTAGSDHDDAALLREMPGAAEPWSRSLPDGTYDLARPVHSSGQQVGWVRVGMPAAGRSSRLGMIATMAAAVVLLLGLVISRIIAISIVRPLGRLREAADDLGTRSWKAPLPVHGTDELSRLAAAFNRLASALKQREASLSRGNRDLFILHAAGLDLLESLDLPILLKRISARAEDLIKSDTTTIAVVDRQARSLAYLSVEGSKAKLLRGLELPLEAGGIYNWMVTYGTPLLIQDARNDVRLDAGLMGTLGVKSLMTVPLWSSNTLSAVLTAVNKRGGEAFDKHDLRLFTVLSNLVGAALQNAFLYADLKGKIEELDAAQEQLVHSSKLAAIGELAANLAHEINNPLTGVLGYAGHLSRTADLPEESRRKLELMEQETLRVRKIIRNLLDFAQQRPSWRQPTDLLVPLRETVALVRGVAEHASVRIDDTYPPEPVIVNMDENEGRQVFLNLLNNALHAMPDGGVLRLRLEPDREGEIAVVFEDTGHGIRPEHLGRIFEPFFSTKSGTGGTGLGLSISLRIARNHGGRIDVQSTVGSGSVFRLVLPLHQKQPVAT